MIGAFGQILVAFVALVIAWRQFVVDQRLTTQQNRITQAQTIDSFMQGLSELISDEDGLLEDWPLERMLAEGRMAAVFGSIDAEGKAKILRFLAHARLLTPLRRDQRLGRAILDGEGNYEVDRLDGVPVIRLHQMLRGWISRASTCAGWISTAPTWGIQPARFGSGRCQPGRGQPQRRRSRWRPAGAHAFLLRHGRGGLTSGSAHPTGF